jgi:hypothetical protein
MIITPENRPKICEYYNSKHTRILTTHKVLFQVSGQSTGTTTDYETYPVNGNQAKWVRVTVTDSGLGTGNSIAQISEIRIFSNV